MSQLFDFSHILNTNPIPFASSTSSSSASSPPLPLNNQSLQDEIDRFLLEASLADSEASSNGSVSPATGISLFPTSFDFLFSYPLASTLNTAPSTQVTNQQQFQQPASPSGSDSSNKHQQQKSTRGRKPKVLSEDEKNAQLQHRKEKNKEFAQVSRDRKRKHVEELETTNQELSERVKLLERQNVTLMQRVLELTGSADAVGSLFGGNSSSVVFSNINGSPPNTRSLLNHASSASSSLTSSASSTSSLLSLWPFNAPHHSQQLYPLLSFFRRRVFGAI
ncbi:UNVERIFIED_CONTAM: hypothetical protein HDU68_003224 [Siphonaria sp. JEL0065]|nr:hypothetical protein HDU68_003224 [Siphonaria sp. JEL0065]